MARSGSNTVGSGVVLHIQQAARRLGDPLALGDHGGDALADIADDIVQHVGIIGIDQVILVRRGAVEPAGHVLPGEDGDHPGQRGGAVPVDAEDARMRVRRAQDLQVQQSLDRRHPSCSAHGR